MLRSEAPRTTIAGVTRQIASSLVSVLAPLLVIGCSHHHLGPDTPAAAVETETEAEGTAPAPAAAAAEVEIPSLEPPGRRPNIIYVMADDLGWGEVGCYGQTKIETPNIDRIAEAGARLTEFYSGSPVCAPSRAVLMTGQHGGRAPVRDNKEIGTWESHRGQMPLPAGSVTMAERLREVGYATGCFGKWGLGEPGSEGDPLRQGFDRFYGYNCQRHAHNYYPRYLIDDDRRVSLDGNDRGRTGEHYAPQLIADELIEFVRDHADRPFLAYYATVIPHLALQVPDDWLARYEGRWEDPPYEGGKGYLPHPHPRAAYAAMVTFLDHQIGRVLDELDALGIADDTIVIVTSDNGPTFDRIGGSDSEFFESAGPFRGLKGSVYEGGLRVPFVARWPGRIPAGSVVEIPFVAYDALPTVLSAAGASIPDRVDGRSMLPALTETGPGPERPFLFWEFAGYGGQQAVRMGRWKAVRRDIRKSGNTRLELFDLDADPGETTDLADAHPDVVRRMESILASERIPTADFPLPAIDPPQQSTEDG